jgi:hypothetical protein
VNWIGRLRVPIEPGQLLCRGVAGHVGRRAPATCAGRDPGLFGGGGADHAGVDHEGELGRRAGRPGFSSVPTTGGGRRRRAGGRIDGEDAGEPRSIRPVAGKFGRRRRPYMARSFLIGESGRKGENRVSPGLTAVAVCCN